MTQEALKLALEALYFLPALSPAQNELQDAAIEAIKEALAQHDSVQAKPEPEQEPVATVESVATVVSESGNQEVTMSWWHEPALPVGTKLYTTPPNPEQEPVAWAWFDEADRRLAGALDYEQPPHYTIPLYTIPPKRTWVGLTFAEICECESEYANVFARNIEAKLKQKNGYAEEKNT